MRAACCYGAWAQAAATAVDPQCPSEVGCSPAQPWNSSFLIHFICLFHTSSEFEEEKVLVWFTGSCWGSTAVAAAGAQAP